MQLYIKMRKLVQIDSQEILSKGRKMQRSIYGILLFHGRKRGYKKIYVYLFILQRSKIEEGETIRLLTYTGGWEWTVRRREGKWAEVMMGEHSLSEFIFLYRSEF